MPDHRPSDAGAADPPPPADDSPTGVDKSGGRVREMFRQIAPRYDAMNHLLSLSVDRYWRRKTVQALRLQENVPVLDVCTGTGDLALGIARRSGSSARVVGTDFCYAMLEIARRKSQRRLAATQRIDFIEADAQALPFSHDKFQCVTVAFGLRNVADTDAGLREMMRVCRPGGQVVVLEFSRPTLPGLRQAYSFYFRHVLPRVGQWLARNDKSAYQYLPESVGEFPCGQELADRMAAVGLQHVEFQPLTFGVVTLYQGSKPAAKPHPPHSAAENRPEANP